MNIRQNNIYTSKIVLFMLIAFEVIVLTCITIMFISRKTAGMDELDSGIRISDFSSDYVTYNNGWYIDSSNASMDTTEGDSEVLHGPYVSIPKGDYTLVVDYECTYTQKLKPSAEGVDSDFTEVKQIDLDDNLTTISYDFRIHYPVNDFEIRAYYNGEGSLYIQDIRLYRNLNPYKRALVIFFVLFMVIDLIILNWKVIAVHKVEVASLLVIFTVLSLPLLIKGIGSPLDDIDFHLMRIEGLYRELQLGHIPSRIQSAWANGNGYPVSIFYGDILLYLPAFLRLMGFSIPFSYGAYVAFISGLTVLISFYSFRIIVKDKYIPLIMTLAYCTTNYRISTVYVRGAVGEFTAVAFLPLIAASLYLIYSDKEPSHKPDIKASILLGISMAAIITSHILSIEMSIVVLVIFCFFNLRKTIRIKTLLTFAIGAIQAAALSLFFTIPFLDYYRNADVIITKEKETISLIQAEGLNLFQLVAFFQDPYVIINRGVAPGMLLMLVFFVAVGFCFLNKADNIIKMMVLFSGFLIFMSTNIFPWDWISLNTSVAGILTVIEFPIRYLAYACLVLTVLCGFILERLKQTVTSQAAVSYSITLITSVSICMMNVFIFFGYYAEEAAIWYPIDSVDIPSDPKMVTDYMRYDEEGEPISYIVSAYNNKNCSKALKILISSAISGIIEMHRNTHFSRKTLHLGEYHV